MAKRRRNPQRKAIRWTAKDLDAMTSPEALMAAQDEIGQAWRRDAPADVRELLAAEPEPDPDAPA